MRTTVTLDPDVEHSLKAAVRTRGQSFKVVLNEAIREGLRTKQSPQKRKPFVVKAQSMGLRPGIDPARLSELADEMEIDAFLASTQKLRETLR